MGHLSYVYKLNRTQEHLTFLHQELLTHLQADSYEIITDSDFEEVADGMRKTKLTRRVVFHKQIPLLRLGVIVGDVVSNLRSALDHVIYAISYSRKPDEFRDDRSTEFPICDNADAFHSSRRQNEIRGLPPEAQAIVEGLQPYHGGKVGDDPLWMLREMSNIDKHRSIHLTTWSAYEVAWDITGVPPGVIIHRHFVRPPGKLESGAIVAEMELSCPADLPNAQMEMNKKFYFTVAFDDDTPLAGQWLEEGLSYLAVYAQGVCSALAPFIKT